MTTELASGVARRQKLACFFGLHGATGGRGTGRRLGEFEWCLRCGRTWESTYDGIEAGWRRRRDLRFGEAVYRYNGLAYPAHMGGRVEWDNPSIIGGLFHQEDFQDGAGVLLTDEDGDYWMVPKRLLREKGWPKLETEPTP